MPDMDKRREKLIELAREILVLSRNTLLVNLRFLDAALNMLELHPCEESTLLTDGQYLIFNPQHVLESYKLAKEIPVRDYLHVVMHCVFQHMFMDPTLDRVYWDLACDITVENVIAELGLKSTAAAREQKQLQYLASLKKELKFLTAEKIYAALRQIDTDHARINEIRALFYADNHEIWYMTDEQKAVAYNLPDENSQNIRKKLNREALAQLWKDISERMKVDVDDFSELHGNIPGAMKQNLSAVNREKYDYYSFLKKFAVMGEMMKINDDEFDYVFYTYVCSFMRICPLLSRLNTRT